MTCVYFMVLALISRLAPILLNYRVMATLLQLSLQTDPALLFLLRLIPAVVMHCLQIPPSLVKAFQAERQLPTSTGIFSRA